MLKAEEWDYMDAMTLEESTNYLTDRINSGLDMVAPIQTKCLGKKPTNLWTTAGTRVSLKKSNQLYKKYKKNPATEKISEFKKYKRQLDKILRMLKSDYYITT